MNDKLKIIMLYDKHDLYHPFMTYANGERVRMPTPNYLTSLDVLHPVAMKVKAELKKLQQKRAWELVQDIDCMCCKPPINGEYSELFDATVEGIIYLQNHSI